MTLATGRPTQREKGQSTVEFALVLPVLLIFMLVAVQVGLLVRDYIMVIHAAREAARSAAVSNGPSGPSTAAQRSGALDPTRMTVMVGQRGGVGSIVTVTVSFKAPTEVPLIGALVGDYEMTASASMRVEN